MTTAALGLAFSAGALASVNPCGFAMLPAMVSFYLGQGEENYPARSPWQRAQEGLALGALVTAGFLLVFVLAGVLVSLGAGALARVFPLATVAIGAALVVLGVWLYLGGSLNVRVPHLEAARVAGSYRAMFVYGVAFVAYSLGMRLLLTAVALGAALFRGAVSTTLRRALPYVQQVSALLLIVAGGTCCGPISRACWRDAAVLRWRMTSKEVCSCVSIIVDIGSCALWLLPPAWLFLERPLFHRTLPRRRRGGARSSRRPRPIPAVRSSCGCSPPRAPPCWSTRTRRRR
jgi:cytochrome c biogenesis protein CcdA